MSKPSEWKGLELEIPATYRIRVQGLLDSSWSDRLGGAISWADAEKNSPVTILIGYLTNQAKVMDCCRIKKDRA